LLSAFGGSIADSRRAFGPCLPDTSAGDTTLGRTGYLDFSHAFVEQAPATPAATNTTFATATAIGVMPFETSATSTVGNGQASVPLWWSWVASFTGEATVHSFGTNYATDVGVLSGANTSAGIDFVQTSSGRNSGSALSLSAVTFNATDGVTYYFRVRQATATFNAPSSGGSCVVGVFQTRTLADGDVFVPVAGLGIVRYRETQLVDLRVYTSLVSGIVIDYSNRPMDSLNGGVHTQPRVYVGVYPRGPVEIFDAQTLNKGENEIDYILDPFPTTSSTDWEDGGYQSQGQLGLDDNGLLYVGWWGNGYTRVAATTTPPGLSGSYLIAAATTNSANVGVIDAVNGDNQPGAPFVADRYAVAVPTAGAGYVAPSADGTTLAYTSGGQYLDVGAQVVKKFNIAGNVQASDIATLVASSTPNPGVKGLTALPAGGWLVTNGSEVVRLNAAGAVIMTYTPSVAEWSESLVDARLTSDGASLWVLDEPSQALFLFDLATGTESVAFRTFLGTGNVSQLAIWFGESPAPVPPVYGTRTVDQRRLRRFPHLSNEQEWVFYRRLQIDMQAGIGLTQGQGSDPQIMLRWSDDGASTWSHEHWRSAGRRGKYAARAQWWQLGRSRQRTFEIVVSDPVPWAFAAAYFSADPGEEF
jgi:hypothetical protein